MRIARLCGTLCLAAAGSLFTSSLFADEPAATAPTTATATTGPTTAPAGGTAATAKISPGGQALLDQISAAYANLQQLDCAGTLSSEISAAGRTENQSYHFTSSFSAPNRFRHSMENDVLCGSTGLKVYSYLKEKNVFTLADAPQARVGSSEMPAPLPQLLQGQNLSLLLALSKSASAELTENASETAQAPDTLLEGVAYQTLKLMMPNKTSRTLLVHPRTHLLRQFKSDIKPLLEAQGVPDVKSAVITVDYATTSTDGPVNDDQFAWTPPQGARDVSKQNAEGGEQEPAMALEGKPAPDFKLVGMDGKTVTLADLKGSVAILDFWATWCPPCRASLPHLTEIYDKFKGAGLKLYAVNAQEEKDDVQKFITQSSLRLPVLLDSSGAAQSSYLARAIPETVVIGKDGRVKKVFVGYSPETEAEIANTVSAALAE